MTSEAKTQDARREAREQNDLSGQYQPIGIGAVAAALMAGVHRPRTETHTAANSNATQRSSDSLAA